MKYIHVVLLALLASAILFGQSVSRISELIQDSAGTPMPNVPVVATDVNRGTTLTT